MPDILGWLALTLDVVLTVVLIRKYRSTRDVGFLWLGLAVVVWPLVSRAATPTLIARLIREQWIGTQGQITVGRIGYSLGLFEQLIGVALLLVAALYLSRAKHHTTPQSAA